ncbi:hypothetical protein Q5H92_22980 [Hymenobacter sp. M29]|uniref:Uncharacterized protein n=1 Tax=Hymenobacter mellowenesis TaxID=3063995 RepID=A0ABT9AKA3_9BACT|nr:hypothetical protein [Hymenobacter sp. M29]MDO7849247.1 hypothetical protein [Hymenobacter sp. M29]
MKRHLLALAGLALLGAHLPTATTSSKTRSGNEVSVKRTHSSQRVPQSDSTQATQPARRATAQVAPFLGDSARYFPKQGPRKVKYGKSRWIVLS